MLTRLPEPGRAKTRLIPALGVAGAAALHRAMAEHVLHEALALDAAGEAEAEVWHAGPSRRARDWLGPRPVLRRQPEADLGGRLRAVIGAGLDGGARACLVVGSDCPAMTADHLRRGLAALARADVVLGPAADGGYWLVGLSAAARLRPWPALFEGVAWGTAEVLAQTLARARESGLAVALLEELRDVDRPEDLAEWERARDRHGEALRVSVVVPALDEEGQVRAAVGSALEAGALEVLVVDGGSRDRTREVAAAAGARVLAAGPGRAVQMNAGAAQARGEALVFLHADTQLPAGAAALVRAALDRPGVVAGAFAYTAQGAGALGPFLTSKGRLRHRLTGHPYGDQAIFLRRRTFRALGGFPELPVMEDWELVRRLRRLGRVEVLPEGAPTDARCLIDAGVVRAGLITFGVVVGYRLGVPAQRLADLRRRVARRPGRPG